MLNTSWVGYSITALMEHHARQLNRLIEQSSIPMSVEEDAKSISMTVFRSTANRKDRRKEERRTGHTIVPINKPYVRETPKKKPWKNQ